MTKRSRSIDRIEINKGKRRLTAYIGGSVSVYTVVLGFSPVGDKQLEGDGCTPEGQFYVCVKNPQSKFHLSLGISYPAPANAERALASGAIKNDEFDAILQAYVDGGMPPQKTALGGEIYIHGGGTEGDWTEGCIAMDNSEMEELFSLVEVGMPVLITK